MWRFLRFVAWVLGVAIVVGGILRLTLFVSWTIPDDALLDASMQPTLGSGDTVLVLRRGTPGLGDLVRCRDPEESSRWVVGRIVGEPGDSIELKGRALRVNGTRFDATEACVEPTFFVQHPDTGNQTEVQCSRVEMGGGWHFRGNLVKYKTGNDAKHDVGPDRVYLLSDNRDMHDDSRDFGTLMAEDCRERIVFRLWGSEGWAGGDRRMDVIR